MYKLAIVKLKTLYNIKTKAAQIPEDDIKSDELLQRLIQHLELMSNHLAVFSNYSKCIIRYRFSLAFTTLLLIIIIIIYISCK